MNSEYNCPRCKCPVIRFSKGVRCMRTSIVDIASSYIESAKSHFRIKPELYYDYTFQKCTYVQYDRFLTNNS